MKKLLLAGIVGIFILTGCVTDPVYDKTKTLYIKGKEVVIKNWDAIPPKIQNELKVVDKVATTYDKVRTEIENHFEKKSANCIQEKNLTKKLKPTK